MSLEASIRQYLNELQRIYFERRNQGKKSIELATRPIAHSLLEGIMANVAEHPESVTVSHEKRSNANGTQPDWRIEDNKTYGVFCYGEHKGLSLPARYRLSNRERSQIQGYLDMGRPVFLFDGIEFKFFNDSLAEHQVVEMVPKEELSAEPDWSTLDINPSIEIAFATLLDQPGFRQWTDKELIAILAARARLISDTVSKLLAAPKGSGVSSEDQDVIAAFHSLQDSLSDHHDPGLANRNECAKFIAQILTFGLYYAHRQFPTTNYTPIERQSAISKYWEDINFSHDGGIFRFFASVLRGINATMAFQKIRPVDNDLTSEMLSWYKDITGILAHAEYMGRKGTPVDFHSLYEKFFVSFDPESRYDRGVFYTPKELTTWIARVVDELSVRHFGAPVKMAADKIIDPCTGTGGFLEALVRLPQQGESRDVELIGYEVLPGPYALAQTRIANVSDEEETDVGHNIRVFLADTLSDRMDEAPGGSHAFLEEVNDASVCARPPVRAIVGNPPSSIQVKSAAMRTGINRLMQDFKPPTTNRSNVGQAINNEAFRFLRWSADKVLQSQHGILGLVIPEAFGRTLSFWRAREWLLRNFEEIWLIQIDEDARSFISTESLFSVQQGRSVLFAVRNGDALLRVDDSCVVKVYSIASLGVEAKRNYLADVDLSGFEEVEVSAPLYRFARGEGGSQERWNACWPLSETNGVKGVFIEPVCSGVKLGMTSLLIHTERPQLLQKIRRAASADSDEKRKLLVEEFLRGQQGLNGAEIERKLTNEVRGSLGTVADADMVRYAYRPFVEAFAVISNSVLDSLARVSSGVRKRPELIRAFAEGTIGIAYAPATVDVDDRMNRFATLVYCLPDNDIAARGSGRVLWTRLPEEGGVANNREHDLAPEIVQLFSWSRTPVESAIHYMYAVMSSAVYLSMFEEMLFDSLSSMNPPRVPLFSDSELLKEISELGRQICECEDMSIAVDLSDSHFVLNWDDHTQEFLLRDFNITLEEDGGSVSLLNEEGVRATICNVRPEILQLRIGGHSVVKSWLRERRFVYLRRTFRYSDFENLHSLLVRIDHQLNLLDQVDVVLSANMASELADLIIE